MSGVTDPAVLATQVREGLDVLVKLSLDDPSAQDVAALIRTDVDALVVLAQQGTEAARERDAILTDLREDRLALARAEAEVARLRAALERIANPEGEWQRHKTKGSYDKPALPFEIARAALAAGVSAATNEGGSK